MFAKAVLSKFRPSLRYAKIQISQNQWIASSTKPLLENIVTVNVPTMGDSITEGTVVEWMKDAGDAVEVGDIITLVETDKVTIDIKADFAGIIKECFVVVDDTVEVGAPLYSVDTDADVSQIQTKQIAETKEHKPSSSLVEETSSSVSIPSSSHKVRIPSIKFLGRAGWALRKQVEAQIIEQNPMPLEAPSIDPMFGRPALTDEEIEALELGGANMSPPIKRFSSGALFG